jgi:hypothetical protein
VKIPALVRVKILSVFQKHLSVGKWELSVLLMLMDVQNPAGTEAIRDEIGGGNLHL